MADTVEVVSEEIEVIVIDLDGGSGPQGDPGLDGWTPVIAVVADGERRVMLIANYTGGTGPLPDDLGKYIGIDGPVDDPADAIDIRGAAGLQGAQGQQGEPGQVLVGGGANIFTEPRDPVVGDGEDGDIWINTISQDLFAKQVGAWVLQTNIKGGPGQAGQQGNPGTPGAPGTNGTNGYSPMIAVVADGQRAVLQIVDYTGGTGTKPATPRYVGLTGPTTDITTAVNVRGASGAPGTPGTNGVNGLSVYSSANDPAENLGVMGEVAINTTTTALFRREGAPSTWVFKFFMKGADSTVQGPKGDPGVQGPKGDPGPASTVQGPKGDPGPAGAAFLSGASNPSNAVGADGDSWVNSLTGDVFKKTAGAWGAAIGSLKGLQGQQGAPGNAGARGTVWFFGQGAPGNIAGQQALDVYVNITTGDVAQYSGSAWVDANFNIKGVQGDPGLQGNPGSPGNNGAPGTNMLIGDGNPSNLQGIPGDVYLNQTSGDLFGPKGASAWPAASGNVKGGKGDPGNAGTNGLNILSGTTDPTGATGVLNELYVNLTSMDVFKKTAANAWSLAFNMKGAQGLQGTPGTQGQQGVQGNPGTQGEPGSPGATIYSGAGAPSNALGLINDFYLNNTTSDFLKKTASNVWTQQVNLKGLFGGFSSFMQANGTDAAAPGAFKLSGTGAAATKVTFNRYFQLTNKDMKPLLDQIGPGTTIVMLSADRTKQQTITITSGNLIDPVATTNYQFNCTVLVVAGAPAPNVENFDLIFTVKGGDAIGAADLNMFFPGKLVAANQIMMIMKVVRAFTLDLTKSFGDSTTLPTAATAWRFNKTGTQFATATFSNTTGLVAFSGTTTQAFAVGDTFAIIGPATLDTTHAGAMLNLWGNR